MEPARRIARIAGPVLVALAPTEAYNLRLFEGHTAPTVYMNGALLFTAGVAILQVHRRWDPDWTTLITLLGWAFSVGGFYRMVAPTGPQAVDGFGAYAVMIVLFVVGLVLTWQGYRRQVR